MMENLSKVDNTTEVDTGIKVEDMQIVKMEIKQEMEDESSPRDLKMENRDESNLEIKSEDIIFEHNTDSNKSQNNFQTPYVQSSSGSNKDSDYMTPKSIHNLNMLFNQSNGKKSQQGPRRIMSNVNIDSSPMDNRVYMNYPYNLNISPIDPSKLNKVSNYSSISNHSNMQIHSGLHGAQSSNSIGSMSSMNMHPNYIFNNNEGVMSINIQNKYFYDRGQSENQGKKFNRRIEFTRNEVNNERMRIKTENVKVEEDESMTESSYSSSGDDIKKPQPINPSSLKKISHGNMKEPIYLRPFQPYGETIVKSQSFTSPQMTVQEYQKKSQEELEKKKFSCNCKRSKCLKLYCECFANGEFCVNCNCLDCSNVIGNEEEKEEAFRTIKDKNPVAMKLNNIKEVAKEENAEAKIGCNCTKSNCSKKYCECYKANVQCTEACRCRDCENSSHKCRENKRKALFSKIDDADMTVYNYDNFEVEKISVFIHNQTISIDKTKFENIEKFLGSKTQINPLNNANISYSSTNSAVFKRINDSFLIEISKSSLAHLQPLSQTPIVNKFKKRRRNISVDSNNSNDLNPHLIKTACETNKKVSNRRNLGMANVVGKKLILDG